VKLTKAEARALRVVRAGGGKASRYRVAQVLSPAEFPDQDINPVRLLAALEAKNLIEKVEGGGNMQWYQAAERKAVLF